MISTKLLSALNSNDELLIDEIADLLRDGMIEPATVCGDLIESLTLTDEGRMRLPKKLPTVLY
jgi:hypothetical protein